MSNQTSEDEKTSGDETSDDEIFEDEIILDAPNLETIRLYPQRLLEWVQNYSIMLTSLGKINNAMVVNINEYLDSDYLFVGRTKPSVNPNVLVIMFYWSKSILIDEWISIYERNNFLVCIRMNNNEGLFTNI